MMPGEVSGWTAGERLAVDRYFEGDGELFLAFKATCIAQFQADFSAAAAAIAAQDRVALRRIVHSLKSVLQTLGHDELGAAARDLEQLVHASAWAQAVSGWHGLEQAIVSAFALPPR